MEMSRILKQINPGKIKLFLFDLDGTLYEDQDHFDYYAECLEERLPPQNRSLFWKDLNSARKGEHPLRLGRVYDRDNDLVLEIDYRGNVKGAWNWKGEPVKGSRLKALYPEPALCNMDDMLYMGDGWWLPVACAFHYGLKNPGPCYEKTKDWLVENDHALNPIPGLARELNDLKRNFPLVLATNSEKDDTKRLLDILNLNDIFSGIYTCCDKPARTENLIELIEKEFQINREAFISIGDNFLNEIAPLRLCGAQTVLIDPHDVFRGKRETGPVVKSIKEIFPLFSYLAGI